MNQTRDTSSQKPFVITFIPARGGSKGVPRKNVLNLCGKPLIAYTIEVARNIDLIDHVVVSTDDEETSEIAAHYGAEVPLMRPAKFAQDNSNVGDAIAHLLDHLRDAWNLPPRFITITLFPTHPFRNVDNIRALVETSIRGFNVNTVNKLERNALSFFSMGKQKRISPIRPHNNHRPRTSQYFYRQSGLFLASNWGPESRPTSLHVVDNPISQIDIDTWADFYLAKEIVKANLFDFGLKGELCSD